MLSSHSISAQALSFKLLHPAQDGRRARPALDDVTRRDLFAMLSHEMRQPLNAILGMAALALEGAAGPEQREYLEIIHSSSQVLRRLVEDALDSARPGIAGPALDQASTDLPLLLRTTLRMLAAEAHGKSLELLVRIHPDTPEDVLCDADRLRQVLINLLANAIKFTEAGEVSLDVMAAQDGTGNRRLWFAVSDTGPGIPEELQASIFEPYWQGGSGVRRPGDGAGLGLAIATSLVGLMGGELHVKSRPGTGSTFHFWIPLHEGQPRARPCRPQLAVGTTALIVDASPQATALLEGILQDLGLKTHGVPSLAEARTMMLTGPSALGKDGYDWVFLAASGRAESGFEAGRELRALSPRSRLVMLLEMTGAAGSIAACREIGAHGFLRKPLFAADVYATLAQDAKPAKRNARRRVAREPVTDSGRVARILLAEDDAVSQLLMCRLLEGLGHSVQALSSGKHAFEAAMNQGFDLIFLDLELPDAGGVETAQRIRNAGIQTAPIIALTAHAHPRYRDLCIESGMVDCMTKPVDIRALRALLSRHLRASASI